MGRLLINLSTTKRSEDFLGEHIAHPLDEPGWYGGWRSSNRSKRWDSKGQSVNQYIEEKKRAELPASQASYIYTDKVQQAVAAAMEMCPYGSSNGDVPIRQQLWIAMGVAIHLSTSMATYPRPWPPIHVHGHVLTKSVERNAAMVNKV